MDYDGLAQFFITATHTLGTVEVPKTYRFYAEDDPDEDYFEASIALDGGQRKIWRLNSNSDLALGMLDTPLPSSVRSYPVLKMNENDDFQGQEVLFFGRSASTDAIPIRQRVGRNVIDSVNMSDLTITMDYDAPRPFGTGSNNSHPAASDITGDGLVDESDWGVLLNNFESGTSYSQGDIDLDGDVDINDGTLIFNARLQSNEGRTGSLGFGEALAETNDSGAPTFRIVNGQPALVGVHWRGQFSTVDSLASLQIGEIAAIMRSEGQSPAVASAGRDIRLPEQLRHLNLVRGDLNGDQAIDDFDLDALNRGILDSQASGSYNWGFDMNDDGVINASDRTFLLTEVLQTYFGDADLNGQVNTNVDIFPALANIGVPLPVIDPQSLWRRGDFNGDGMVNINTDIFPSYANVGQPSFRNHNGDFTQNGLFELNDINLLLLETRTPTGDHRFDLTNDDTVDSEDIKYLIEEVFGTLLGDFNLDSRVDAVDFQIWTNSYFAGNTSGNWESGDLNGDGIVDLLDEPPVVGVVSPDFPTAQFGWDGVGGIPVPEPTAISLWAVLLLSAAARGRPYRSNGVDCTQITKKGPF